MNILTVLRSELEANGRFVPSDRVQRHLRNILRAQDCDLVKVGVICGQKGMAQIHVIVSAGNPNKCKVKQDVTYAVQLLPLTLAESSLAKELVEKLNQPDTSGNITENDADSDSAFSPRNVKGQESEGLGVRRNDRFRFPPLEPAELEPWFRHPYETTALDVVSPNWLTSLSEKVPKSLLTKTKSQPRIDIFMALPRPKLVDKILQYTAAMSLGRIHFFASSRSDISYFSSPKISEAAFAENIRIGLEQGMRTTPSPITVSGSLRTALLSADEFYRKAPDQFASLIAHPYEVTTDNDTIMQPLHMLETGLTKYNGNVILILGPEGGFADAEVRTLLAQMPNPKLVSLGEDILRCEVALIALISQTHMLLTAEGNSACRTFDPRLSESAIFISPPGRKKQRVTSPERVSAQHLEAEAVDSMPTDPRPQVD